MRSTFEEVRAHAFQHDLLVDVDHVGVADFAAVHDVGHLHARPQFVGLRLHGEDADLAGFQIVERSRAADRSAAAAPALPAPRRDREQPSASSSRTMLAAISRLASSVMTVTFSLGWMRRHTSHRIARAGRKFRIEGERAQLRLASLAGNVITAALLTASLGFRLGHVPLPFLQ